MESAVDVAVMVTESAPLLAGAKVTGVPELMLVASLKVPATAGLIETFTVFANAPVPVTVGVQDVVCVSVMDVGLQARETAVMAGGAAGAVMEIFAVPSFVESSVEIALTLSEPAAGTADGAVYRPELETVPETADHVTLEL
ncbi:MAG: hypothetical protein WBQ95_20490 [Terracidiphilus sp.]